MQYFDELNALAKEIDYHWMTITSSASDLNRLLSDIRSHLEEPSSIPIPTPFSGYTISQVYNFSKDVLRRPEDTNLVGPFSDFTFLVVDEDCLGNYSSSAKDAAGPPPTLLVFSDAPDIHESETEVVLKKRRTPLVEALLDVRAIENLNMTLKECARGDPPVGKQWSVISVAPSAQLTPVEPFTNYKNQKYRFATRREAWYRKRKGIMMAEAAGWDEWMTADNPSGWKMLGVSPKNP